MKVNKSRLETIKMENHRGGVEMSYLGSSILPHRNRRSRSLMHQTIRGNNGSFDDVMEGSSLDDRKTRGRTFEREPQRPTRRRFTVKPMMRKISNTWGRTQNH
jgi:hypothetical protein